jgi:hypothetical protein
MAEIAFDAGEADDLEEFMNGEGSCLLTYDSGFRLYDLLHERAPGEPVRWEVEPSEVAEMLWEIEDCADDGYERTPELLAERLRAIAPPEGGWPGRKGHVRP